MGDSGSTFLGFVIGGLIIYFTQKGNTQIKPIVALWLVAVPANDMISTMIRRAVKKQPILMADRTHLHHILLKGGMTRIQALITLTLYSAICATAGIMLMAVEQHISFSVFCLVFFCHMYALKHAYMASKQVKRTLVVYRGVKKKIKRLAFN